MNFIISAGLCVGGLYEGRAYKWSNTSVKEKVGLSTEGPISRGRGGGLTGGEIRHIFLTLNDA